MPKPPQKNVESPQQPAVERLQYTIKDAAFALSFSVRAVNYMIFHKKLKIRRFGSRVFIPASEVKRIARQDNLDGCGIPQKPNE